MPLTSYGRRHLYKFSQTRLAPWWCGGAPGRRSHCKAIGEGDGESTKSATFAPNGGGPLTAYVP